jgi:hypothetical protein
VRLSAWAEVRGPRVLRPKYVMGPGRERAWNTARCSPRVEVEPILRVGIGPSCPSRKCCQSRGQCLANVAKAHALFSREGDLKLPVVVLVGIVPYEKDSRGTLTYNPIRIRMIRRHRRLRHGCTTR